jgi:hypothetical protein
VGAAEAEGGEVETLASGTEKAGERETDGNGRKKSVCNKKHASLNFPPPRGRLPFQEQETTPGPGLLVTINQSWLPRSPSTPSEAPIYSIQIRQLQASGKPPPAVKHTTTSPPSLVVPLFAA